MILSHLLLHISCMGDESFLYHIVDKDEIINPSYSDSSGITLRAKVSKQALVLNTFNVVGSRST